MRDPVLHIKLSSLQKIFGQLDVKPEMAMKVLEVAVKGKHQLKNHYFVTAKKTKVRATVNRTIKSESDFTEVFNRVLTSVMQMKRFKHIPVVHKDSKNYTLLKEIAVIAEE